MDECVGEFSILDGSRSRPGNIFFDAGDIDKTNNAINECDGLREDEYIENLLQLSMLWIMPDGHEKLNIWRHYCPTAPLTTENLLHAIYNAALPIHMRDRQKRLP